MSGEIKPPSDYTRIPRDDGSFGPDTDTVTSPQSGSVRRLDADAPQTVTKPTSEQWMKADRQRRREANAVNVDQDVSADIIKFGTLLALDPTGAVLVLANMVLRWVLEDETARTRLGLEKPGSEVAKAHGIIAKQKLNGTTFNVESYADKLFTPGEGIIKLLYDILAAAVPPDTRAASTTPGPGED